MNGLPVFEIPDDLRAKLAELDRDLLEQHVLKLGCALAAMVRRHGVETDGEWSATCTLSAVLDPENMGREIEFRTDVEWDQLELVVRRQARPARRL